MTHNLLGSNNGASWIFRLRFPSARLTPNSCKYFLICSNGRMCIWTDEYPKAPYRISLFFHILKPIHISLVRWQLGDSVLSVLAYVVYVCQSYTQIRLVRLSHRRSYTMDVEIVCPRAHTYIVKWWFKGVIVFALGSWRSHVFEL